MKAQLFEELVKSIKDGGAILRGEKAPSRSFKLVPPPSRKSARKRGSPNPRSSRH
jgi:hypothetical protein